MPLGPQWIEVHVEHLHLVLDKFFCAHGREHVPIQRRIARGIDIVDVGEVGGGLCVHMVAGSHEGGTQQQDKHATAIPSLEHPLHGTRLGMKGGRHGSVERRGLRTAFPLLKYGRRPKDMGCVPRVAHMGVWATPQTAWPLALKLLPRGSCTALTHRTRTRSRSRRRRRHTRTSWHSGCNTGPSVWT